MFVEAVVPMHAQELGDSLGRRIKKKKRTRPNAPTNNNLPVLAVAKARPRIRRGPRGREITWKEKAKTTSVRIPKKLLALKVTFPLPQRDRTRSKGIRIIFSGNLGISGREHGLGRGGLCCYNLII